MFRTAARAISTWSTDETTGRSAGSNRRPSDKRPVSRNPPKPCIGRRAVRAVSCAQMMHFPQFLDSRRSGSTSRPATSASCSSSSRSCRAAAGSTPAARRRLNAEREKSARLDRLRQGSRSRTARSTGPSASTRLVARLADPVDYKAIDGSRSTSSSCCCRRPMRRRASEGAAASAACAAMPDAREMRGARTRDAFAAVLMGAEERDAA